MLSLKPRAILVDVIPPKMEKEVADRRLYELECLTRTYGGIVVVKIVQKRSLPDYKTYLGPGKLDELVAFAKANKVELIVINNILKPHQIFGIEKRVERDNIAVWDRIDMILKIFQKHASTTEAKLEIRLAGIRHMGPRIFRMGMELGQQQGGIGARGGGETNIEIMKRHLEEQERNIRKQLERYSTHRGVHRAHRDRMGLKTASIVGYTNAGKSSLLNALTRKGAYVADELFATLDTRVAKLWLPNKSSVASDATSPLLKETQETESPLVKGKAELSSRGNEGGLVLLSDTIGFIQDLPPQLIDAFRSTLEETVHANLILHVIDVTDPFMDEKISEVEGILSQLGVTNTKKIYVFNKIDLKKRIPRTSIIKKYREFSPVFVSSVTSQGLDDLKAELAVKLA